MNASPHVPVLADAVNRLACVRPGDVWVDCTLGFGGHTEALLKAGARVIGIDQDRDARVQTAARLASYGAQLQVVAGNFRDLDAVLAELGVDTVDGIFADIGVSSWQLDQAARGFSFMGRGPVDMRMNPEGPTTALDMLHELAVGELAGVVRSYGEERYAGPVARAMKAWRAGAGPFDTVGLAAAIVAALPRKEAARRKRHPATKTFQALRIAVNDELGALDALLEQAPERLAANGRLMVITFHSLEDRRVKRSFAALSGKTRPQAPRRGLPPPPAPPAGFELLTRRPVMASEDESSENPRARSARLRAIRRLAADEIVSEVGR